MRFIVDEMPESAEKCDCYACHEARRCGLTGYLCSYDDNTGKCDQLVTIGDALAEMVSNDPISVTTDSDIDPGFYITRK